MSARATAAAILAITALGIGACGDDEGDSASSSANAPAPTETVPAVTDATVTATTATQTVTTATATTSTTAPSGSSSKLDISKDRSIKPAIPRLSGDPPTKLVVQDVVKGKGRTVRENDNITVDYVGVSYSTGEQFDSSWDRGEPATFPLTKGGLINGWVQGIPGMKLGGRRLLIIPPDLAYADSPPAGIAPGETLIFVIDMKKAEA